MEKRLADLKTGLANARKNLRLNRHDELVLSLEKAAETYDAADDKKKKGSAMMALDAVLAFLRDERLEAPLRFIIDELDAHWREGRRTKTMDTAREDAMTVATVDALRDEATKNGERLSLDEACKKVAKATGYKITAKQLKHLRENIRYGKERAEATDVYNFHRRWRNHSFDGPPAALTLDTVKDIWAARPQTKSCR